jgi:hypothetical protein
MSYNPVAVSICSPCTFVLSEVDLAKRTTLSDAIVIKNFSIGAEVRPLSNKRASERCIRLTGKDPMERLPALKIHETHQRRSQDSDHSSRRHLIDWVFALCFQAES